MVVANPGQLIWCYSKGKAMGRLEWECQPRESAIHAPFQVEEKNLVDGHHDTEEHVESVFENVLRQAGNPQAKIDIIGAEWVGTAVVKYLASNCRSFLRNTC